MKLYLLAALALVCSVCCAEENLMDLPDRDPAAISIQAPSAKRTYPGGGDEEDLQVQAHLPEAPVKTDARSVQREVYKDLYNQEMKEERQETVDE